MLHRLITTTAICLSIVSLSPLHAQEGATWDGLVRVKAKKLDAVFLKPDADFRVYSKVMLDHPQLAFEKNWKRDQNRGVRAIGSVSDRDIREAIDKGSERFKTILRDAYVKAGYELVDEPGPDVLRVTTGVLNIMVNAPDVSTAARTRTYAQDAGEGTLVVEVRDSVTGALIGRALDARVAGDNMMYIANRATNRWEFEELFETWAKISAEALDKLKAASPIDTAGELAK